MESQHMKASLDKGSKMSFFKEKKKRERKKNFLYLEIDLFQIESIAPRAMG